MADIVECHSGYTYAERPAALLWQGQRLIVMNILSQGRTPQGKWFRVKTTNGKCFQLDWVEATGALSSEIEWQIHEL